MVLGGRPPGRVGRRRVFFAAMRNARPVIGAGVVASSSLNASRLVSCPVPMAPHDRRQPRKPSSAAPKKRTASAGAKKKTYGKNARGDDKFKRTSKNTDDRNPTRSGIDYPS